MITLNGFIVNPTIFPDKTSQVWKIDPSLFLEERNVVTWYFEEEAELLHIAQLCDLIQDEREGLISLYIPYFPYARQDKEVNNGLTFALSTFLNLLDRVLFDTLFTFDIHNESSLAGSGIINIQADQLINSLAKEYDYIVFGDESASKRYKVSKPFSWGEKVRDQATGHITHYEVKGAITGCNDLALAKRVLIVDDIFDGGATYKLLGQRLKELNIKADVYCSHGIFSKGLDTFTDTFGKIITTDSYLRGQEFEDKYSQFLEVYSWQTPHQRIR